MNLNLKYLFFVCVGGKGVYFFNYESKFKIIFFSGGGGGGGGDTY